MATEPALRAFAMHEPRQQYGPSRDQVENQRNPKYANILRNWWMTDLMHP